MATAQILAVGTTAANSTAVTITAAAPARLSLFKTGDGAIPPDILCEVETQASNAAWHKTGLVLAGSPGPYGNRLMYVHLTAPGVYRVARPVTTTAVGIDSAT